MPKTNLTKAQLKKFEERLNSAGSDYDVTFKIVPAKNGFTVKMSDEDCGGEGKSRFRYADMVDDRDMVIMENEYNKDGWLMELIPSLLFSVLYV